MDNTKLFDQAELLSKMWTDFAGKMTAAGLSVQPGTPPPEAMRKIRDAFFQAMGQSLDQYMRSEPFLQSMKQSMDSAIAFRKQSNDLLTQWRHELQGTASEDVDNLLLAVRHMETRVLESMDQMAGRIEAISARLDRMEEMEKMEERGGDEAHGNGSSDLKRPGGGAARKGIKKQDEQ